MARRGKEYTTQCKTFEQLFRKNMTDRQRKKLIHNSAVFFSL